MRNSKILPVFRELLVGVKQLQKESELASEHLAELLVGGDGA